MNSFIRNLSPRAEFCLVLLIGFGLFLVRTIWLFTHPQSVTMTDSRVLTLVVIELLQLAAVLWIGRQRGWSVSTFGSQINWKLTGLGILLFLATLLVQGLVGLLAYAFHPALPKFETAGLTLPVILLVSIVNPVFEEVLEAGYFVHALERFGMAPVIVASGLLRGLLHIYQGPNGALTALATGLLFATVYWRRRQLWPLIVAHFFLDFLGLLMLVHSAQ